VCARKPEDVWHHLGVVHGLAENPGAEGGHIEDGSQRHTAPVLKACNALEGHLLGYNIDVWKAPFFLQQPSASCLTRRFGSSKRATHKASARDISKLCDAGIKSALMQGVRSTVYGQDLIETITHQALK